MTSFNTNTVATPTAGRGFLRTLSGAISRGVKCVQVAQMISVLSRLSDTQLEEIGVKRNEIAQHAENYINGTASV